MGRGKKQEAQSKNTRSSCQSGSSSDTLGVEFAFITHDLVARARSEKQEARKIQNSPKPPLPNPAFSVCLLSLYSMNDSVTNSK